MFLFLNCLVFLSNITENVLQFFSFSILNSLSYHHLCQISFKGKDLFELIEKFKFLIFVVFVSYFKDNMLIETDIIIQIIRFLLF